MCKNAFSRRLYHSSVIWVCDKEKKKIKKDEKRKDVKRWKKNEKKKIKKCMMMICMC